MLTITACAKEPTYGVLKYKNDARFQTGVFNPKLIAQLPAEGKEPFLIFSGRGCEECDANTSIYIHSPSDGPMQGTERDQRFTYPGNYFDTETGKPIERVRMFVGQCFAPAKYVAAWFSSSKTENGKWESSVFLAEVEGGKLVAHLAQKPVPTVARVRTSVTAGACHEVPRKSKLFTEP